MQPMLWEIACRRKLQSKGVTMKMFGILADKILGMTAWARLRRIAVRFSLASSEEAAPVKPFDLAIVPTSPESRAWRIYSSCAVMRANRAESASPFERRGPRPPVAGLNSCDAA